MTSRRAPRVPFVLLVAGLLVGGLLLLLALNTASAANELRRSALADKDQEVSADVAQLQNEVAASAAPANLLRAAQALGMVPAGNPAFIIEYPDGRTILRGHPKPVSDQPLDIPSGTAHSTPTPTARTSPTATTSPSTSTSKSATTTAAKSASRSSSAKAGKHTRHAKRHHPAASSSPASPTSTPTPTITLPGGNR